MDASRNRHQTDTKETWHRVSVRGYNGSADSGFIGQFAGDSFNNRHENWRERVGEILVSTMLLEL